MSAKRVATIHVEIAVFDGSEGWYGWRDSDGNPDDYWPERITAYVRDSINERSAVINAEVSLAISHISWTLAGEDEA